MDLLVFVISFVASFIFALGGVGAAIVLIPILVWLGVPINTAKPVGLFYNTVSLAGASLHNIKNKRLDYKTSLPIIISSLIFAALGAYSSKFIPVKIVLWLFIVFLIFSGSMFLLHRKREEHEYHNGRPYLKLALIGAFAGFLSGLLGIGGGNIISPLMLMSNFHPKKITTITAFVVPFSSFTAFLTYWAIGNVNWELTLVASFGGILGATLGTHVMHTKLHHETVKKILAAILLLLAIKLIFKAI